MRIEDYALIGDCETAPLISTHGSIDWLCFPRFDSPACFAALLGTPENGRWSIAAEDPQTRSSRRYRDDTLILKTQFETPDGAATLIDFMPPRDEAADLVRLIVGQRGRLTFDVNLVIRFDYGRSVPWVSRVDDETLTAVAGPDLLVLRTPVALCGEDFHTVGTFTVSTSSAFPSSSPTCRRTGSRRRRGTRKRRWRERRRSGGRFTIAVRRSGPWTADVKRSLITLKALTYMPTGGIVAAATTSLPEHIGGPRNWDYRICWLRDATATLLAFMNLGYFEEAAAWREWLMRTAAGDPGQMQIMYGVAGERRLPRMGGAVAFRLHGLAAGPRRQRRLGAVPARHLRRSGRCDDTGAQRRAAAARCRNSLSPYIQMPSPSQIWGLI